MNTNVSSSALGVALCLEHGHQTDLERELGRELELDLGPYIYLVMERSVVVGHQCGMDITWG